MSTESEMVTSESEAPKRKQGAPQGNTNSRKYGLWPLKRAIVARGLAALDKRSSTYRELMERREQLITELGGHDNLTKQQEVVVDIVSRELLFLDQVDSWVLAQDSILVGRGRKKTLLPVFRHRDAIVKRIYSGLSLIGLERRAKQVVSAIDLVRGNGSGEQEPTA